MNVWQCNMDLWSNCVFILIGLQLKVKDHHLVHVTLYPLVRGENSIFSQQPNNLVICQKLFLQIYFPSMKRLFIFHLICLFEAHCNLCVFGMNKEVELKSTALLKQILPPIQYNRTLLLQIYRCVYFSNAHRQRKMLTHLVQRKAARLRVCVCLTLVTLPSALFCLGFDCLSLCVNSDMSFSLFTVLSLVFWVSPCSRAVGGSDGVLDQIKASQPGQCSPCPLSELWRCCYSQLVLTSGYQCLPQSALSTAIRDRLMSVVNTDTHRLFILPSYIDVMVFIQNNYIYYALPLYLTLKESC